MSEPKNAHFRGEIVRDRQGYWTWRIVQKADGEIFATTPKRWAEYRQASMTLDLFVAGGVDRGPAGHYVDVL